jgi:hypothetical protein
VSRQTWEETLIVAETDGTAIANTTTATSLLGAGASAAKFTLPANFFDIGKGLRLTARGRISTVNTTPGNLTLDIRLGSVIVFNGGSMALNIVAKTNVSWELVVDLVCRSVGSSTSATLLGMGRWMSEAAASAVATEAAIYMLPASAPAVGTGFDSTTAQALDVFSTFSVANASNSIQLHQLMVEALN